MKTYGFDYHQHGMTDTESGFLPRGSRVRWIGQILSSFFDADRLRTVIGDELVKAGLTPESVDVYRDSVAWLAAKEVFDVVINVVIPFDWNQTDASQRITAAVQFAAQQVPQNLSFVVLLRPTGTDATGQPIYPAAPTNIPSGYNPPGNTGNDSGNNFLDDLSEQLGITKTAIAFGAVALTLLLVLKK